MAQLWGGRFTKATDELVYRFNASITFDRTLFEQDIEGSIAHAVMLEKQKILTCEEKDDIVKGLTGIREDVLEGRLAITEQYEDIHSFVEAVLTERIGEAGKKLHTGRSRNDQVALDMKLYVRGQVLEITSCLDHLLETLLSLMEKNLNTYMPASPMPQMRRIIWWEKGCLFGMPMESSESWCSTVLKKTAASTI